MGETMHKHCLHQSLNVMERMTHTRQTDREREKERERNSQGVKERNIEGETDDHGVLLLKHASQCERT